VTVARLARNPSFAEGESWGRRDGDEEGKMRNEKMEMEKWKTNVEDE
jgi:hypothetical protein